MYELLKGYIQMYIATKELPYDEELCCVELAKDGDQESIDRLVFSKMGFILRVAVRTFNGIVDLEDLIHAGVVGFLKSISTFDKDKSKFITYAGNAVVSHIKNANFKTGKDRYENETIRNMKKAIEILKKVGVEVTVEALMEETGYGRRRLMGCEIASGRKVDSITNEDGEDLDIKDDKNSEKLILQRNLTEKVREYIKLLPLHHSELLELMLEVNYIGSDGGICRDVGNRVGLSRTTVASRLNEGAEKLKKLKVIKELADEIGLDTNGPLGFRWVNKFDKM